MIRRRRDVVLGSLLLHRVRRTAEHSSHAPWRQAFHAAAGDDVSGRRLILVSPRLVVGPQPGVSDVRGRRLVDETFRTPVPVGSASAVLVRRCSLRLPLCDCGWSTDVAWCHSRRRRQSIHSNDGDEDAAEERQESENGHQQLPFFQDNLVYASTSKSRIGR